MLVLSRRPGETIVIGNVVVHVSSIRTGKVRIAIDAPQDVVVLRGEIAARANQWSYDEPNHRQALLPTMHVALVQPTWGARSE